jgi:hypothetical protein
MRKGLFSLIVAAACIGASAPVYAQTPVNSVAPVCSITEEISAQCLKEFNDWFKREIKFRKWSDLNFNKLARGGWNWSPQDRKARPVPPEWLESYCQGTFQSDVTSDQICPRYNALKDYDWLSARNHTLLAQLRAQRERPTHSSFKQRIHFDALYTAAEFPSPHIYGAIGIHVGLIPVGRCQINIVPGSMLISRPDNSGGRNWQPAVTVGGGSCALSKFTFPGTRKQGLLHVNVVRVHVMGQTSEAMLLHSGADLTLMGFSFTLR